MKAEKKRSVLRITCSFVGAYDHFCGNGMLLYDEREGARGIPVFFGRAVRASSYDEGAFPHLAFADRFVRTLRSARRRARQILRYGPARGHGRCIRRVLVLRDRVASVAFNCRGARFRRAGPPVHSVRDACLYADIRRMRLIRALQKTRRRVGG